MVPAITNGLFVVLMLNNKKSNYYIYILMNLENKGKIIASIINKIDPKKNKDIYNENDKNNIKNYLEEIILDSDEYIQQIPDKKIERSVLYITGASGSGKSYYTREYIKQYRITFPKNGIYLFSSLNEDATLDKLTYIKRVNLDDGFLSTPFTIEDFKNSLIIYDDIDVISYKPMKRKLYEIMDMILQTGRHSRTSFIFTSHQANKGNDTKMILNECHSITIFPNNMGKRTSQYLLEGMFGFDRDDIKKIRKIGTKSRWVSILKTFPIIVAYNNGAYVVNTEDK